MSFTLLNTHILTVVMFVHHFLVRIKELMLKKQTMMCVFLLKSQKRKFVIWGAEITVFAVPILFFSCTTALTLFVLITVYIEFLLCVNTLMEEMDATSIKSG